MKTYDKLGRESGNFPNTEQELKELKIYEEKLKNIKKHLENDIKEHEKSIEEDKELEKTLGKMR